MALISAAQKANLQASHRTDVYASVHVPDVVWSARINDGSIEIGATDIDFDSGSGVSFGMVRVASEVWIGSNPGDDDIGRGRVRAATSGDGGVTGSINIAPNSFQFVDDLYLTFLLDFPVKPTYSYVDPMTETFYKDYDQPYTDENSFPPPVVVAGPHQADFIDNTLGYLEIPVNLVNSYAMTDGATIASYAMEVLTLPGNSYTTSFDTGTGLGYIRMEDPGNYWVKYTVTDSNGRGQQSWRWYRAHSADPTSPHYPLVDFSLSLAGSYENGGYQAGINAHDGFALDELPARALVLIWHEVVWSDPGNPVTRGWVTQNKFAGYVVSADDDLDLDEGIATADFALTTPEGRLRNLYGFSLTLRATPDTVDDWYLYEEWMTTGHAVHHLLRWHTTLLLVCDVIGLNIHPDLRVGAMVQDGDIYSMANSLYWEQGVRARLISHPSGQLRVTNDPQLMIDATRAAINEVMEIEKADRSGPIIVHRRQTRIAPFVTVSGIYWDGTFEGGDETKPVIGDYCAQAPGAHAEDDGPSPTSLDNQLFASQTNANQVAGRLLASVNNPFPSIDIHFAGNYLDVLDVAELTYYSINLQVTDTPSGAIVGIKRLYLREVTVEYNPELGVLLTTGTFEPEATGHDGVETECPGLPDLGGFPEPPPIETELPGGLLTSASVNYLTPQGSSWTVKTAEATAHMVADPFWRTRQGSFASKDAIVLRCGQGYIKRTTDNFG